MGRRVEAVARGGAGTGPRKYACGAFGTKEDRISSAAGRGGPALGRACESQESHEHAGGKASTVDLRERVYACFDHLSARAVRVPGRRERDEAML